MGPGPLNVAVADAGPLIHLAEIGCLEFLRVFELLHVPDAVWAETVGLGRVCGADFLELGIVQRHSLPEAAVARFVREQSIDHLQRGECESLYLCRATSLSILLTDDLAVREEAERLGLRPVGSLGIVVRAYRVGRVSLDQAEQHLWGLYDASTLFVTRTIVELAIEQLRRRVRRS